jgi:hypothetical protein
MIQVRKYGEYSDANNDPAVGHWTLVGEFEDEDELLGRVSDGALAPGLFRIYTATKATADDGLTPKGWNLDRDVVVKQPSAPKAKLEAA